MAKVEEAPAPAPVQKLDAPGTPMPVPKRTEAQAKSAQRVRGQYKDKGKLDARMDPAPVGEDGVLRLWNVEHDIFVRVLPDGTTEDDHGWAIAAEGPSNYAAENKAYQAARAAGHKDGDPELEQHRKGQRLYWSHYFKDLEERRAKGQLKRNIKPRAKAAEATPAPAAAGEPTTDAAQA